ncbi:MAG TPA: hypothetical protein VIW64_10040 [Pyrinomonadaceae bacterium]|jgi:hypothetical protein
MNNDSTQTNSETAETESRATNDANLPEEGPATKASPWQDWLARVFTILLWPTIIAGMAWFVSPRARIFLTDHWKGVIVLLAAALILVSIPSTQRYYARINAQRRIGLVIVGLIVFIVLFFVVVFLLEPVYQAALLRTIFLIVVCSLPALMYYLFIATKKTSLHNEFWLNLTRLGLVNPEKLKIPRELISNELRNETPEDRKERLNTYRQKFEAVYGKIPTDRSDTVVDPIGPKSNLPNPNEKVDTESLSAIFTVDTTIPVIVATLLIALGWLITLPPWQGKLEFGNQSNKTSTEVQSIKSDGAGATLPQADPASGVQPPAQATPAPAETSTEKWIAVYEPVSTPVRFAFIGAYFFALQMLFRRYVRRDLRSSAYVAVSMRVLLAVIGIWVVGEAVKVAPEAWVTTAKGDTHSVDKTLLVLGFVIGVFPRVAWQVIQAAIKRACSVVVPSLQTQLPLSDLDGLTVWHEARLEEEDVENIPNMATADLIDLFINTRFPPDRIIDWVDQSILYTQLGPQPKEDDPASVRTILRAHGIRNASSLVENYNRSEFHGDRAAFEDIMPENKRSTMRSLVDAVGSNPTLKLIQTWRGLMPHSHEPATFEPRPQLIPEANTRESMPA